MFKPRIRFQERRIQGTVVKGKAILVSNHTSVYDYGFWLFYLPFRTHRCVMADVLKTKSRLLSLFLKMMGGIFTSRKVDDLAFISKCKSVLDRNGVVEIFPESRLPKSGESRPLEFKPSFVYLALECDAPIIPLYTSGDYFSKRRCNAVVGTPIHLSDYYDDSKSKKENLKELSEMIRQRIISLGEEVAYK